MTQVWNATARTCEGEGADATGWVLLDWGDIVVHLFGPAEREFYSLEKLWGDARIFSYDAETP